MQEQSPLYTMATSLEDAIDNILQIMAEYIGEKEGGNVDVRTELDVESKSSILQRHWPFSPCARAATFAASMRLKPCKSST
jgi:hypothetical protein